MAHKLNIAADGLAVRRDFADHAVGDAVRAHYRDQGGGKDLRSPFNEGFNFTRDEYELLKKTHPQLFVKDPKERLANWRRWALTSEGRAFRIR